MTCKRSLHGPDPNLQPFAVDGLPNRLPVEVDSFVGDYPDVPSGEAVAKNRELPISDPATKARIVPESFSWDEAMSLKENGPVPGSNRHESGYSLWCGSCGRLEHFQIDRLEAFSTAGWPCCCGEVMYCGPGTANSKGLESAPLRSTVTRPEN
jgi:hypothetical protein